MSPHPGRNQTLPSLIALAATLVAASLGLAACGGSSSTTTTTTVQTAANAAATGATTGTTTAGATTTTGTTTTGTTTTGTPSGDASSTGTSSTGATTTPRGSTTGTAPANRTARIAAVRTCLTKKGITLGAGGLGGAHLPKGMTRAQFLEAFESCGKGLTGQPRRQRQGFNNPSTALAITPCSRASRRACVRTGSKSANPTPRAKARSSTPKGSTPAARSSKRRWQAAAARYWGAYAPAPGASAPAEGASRGRRQPPARRGRRAHGWWAPPAGRGSPPSWA